MKKVRYIPAKPIELKKIRVAAYCRVSTSTSVQMRSLKTQIESYTNMIENCPDWISSGVFYDIGSGLRRTGRTGLNALLRKAKGGKVDYILTKSISRVSRDTLELLKIIRTLRERGINMYFENENLDSIKQDKEFEITLRSMLTQDESRNISENIQWGFQRKFEKGNIFTKYKNFMGYTCIDGEIVIVPEQAEVVSKIFELYLQGKTFRQIKRYLESMNIKTVTGNEQWDTTTIQKMLKNEKYKGDTLLQKTYTEDFMTGRKVKNTGQRKQYYINKSHPAIVSDEVFDRVQEEMIKRARVIRHEDGTASLSTNKYNGKYLLGNLLVCGDCGASYRRRTERGNVVWRCATRIEKGKEACLESPTVKEEWIKERLTSMVSGELYEENIIRERIGQICVYQKHLVVKGKNDIEWII
jgi:site-specific DNA recombinase